MNQRVRVVQLLLRAYPPIWREKYGEELVTILEDRSLTLAIVRDVFQNGLLQRARYAEAWQVGGIALAIWLIAGTALNSIRAFPQWGYDLFWQIHLGTALVIGYISVARDRKSQLASAIAAGRASLVGITPELVLAALWMAGLVHPTILQLNGSSMVVGHGITDLCIRADVKIPPTHLLLTPLATAIPGLIAGWVGAGAAQFVSGFREGSRPSKT
jgi:hypothetical protein